jgi:hypothetical protein
MDASAPAVMREATAQLHRGPVIDLARVRRARDVLANVDLASARMEGYAAGVEVANMDTWFRGAKVGIGCGLLLGLFAGALLFRVGTAMGLAS